MAGIESELLESYGDRSKSPMPATEEDSSSSKSKSPMPATEEDSSSSKSKSPLPSTDDPMSSPKAVNIDGGVEEDIDEDDDVFGLFDNDPGQALSDDEFYDSSDDEFYYPGRRKMTAEEISAYIKQVRDSEGFDVDPTPEGVRPYGNIFASRHIDKTCRKVTDFAIERHNSDENRNLNRKLKLKRYIKWNQELACPVNYYLTFEAEDVDTGEVETYQAKVELRIPDEETEMPIFRVKPRPAESSR